MQDTTQSEEFLRTTVNGVDFVVIKSLSESNDTYNEYCFSTEYQGEDRALKLRLQSKAVTDLQDDHGIDAESELMEIMKTEIQMELERLTART